MTNGFIKKKSSGYIYKQLQREQRTNVILKGFHCLKVDFVHYYAACLNNITL